MTTIRQQIIDALQARLETITIVNGYATDAGSNVFVWRKHAVLPTETPCLLVQDNNLAREYGKVINKAQNTLTFEILAVAHGDTTVAAARQMEGDLVKCLAAWDTAGGLADRLLVVKSTPTMEQHEKLTGMVQVTVEAVYTTARGLC